MKYWIPLVALAVAVSPLGFVHPVRVQGHSMEPLLPDGSLRVALRSWCAGPPARGQVWLLEGPQGPVIKRVLGLPGEHLEQRDGVLFLEGRRLEEPYLERYDQGDAPLATGSGYAVLGDNRQASRDSRTWGPLPLGAFRSRILGL